MSTLMKLRDVQCMNKEKDLESAQLSACQMNEDSNGVSMEGRKRKLNY